MFVGGFIGSPPMNFAVGEASGGEFQSPGTTVSGAPRDGRLTIGFRAEDVVIGEGGRFQGSVFEVEPTGDATYVVTELGGSHAVIRADKKFRPEPGIPISFDVEPSQLLYFDTDTGRRIRE